MKIAVQGQKHTSACSLPCPTYRVVKPHCFFFHGHFTAGRLTALVILVLNKKPSQTAFLSKVSLKLKSGFLSALHFLLSELY